MTWQPIDTAPDHQIVLIAFKNALGNWRIVKAAFYPDKTLEGDHDYGAVFDEEAETYYHPEGWYEDVYAETGLDYSLIYLGEDPTHWMPLPKPPQEVAP